MTPSPLLQVALWDNQLRLNQRAAEALGDSVHRLYDNQEQLLRDCDTIEAYQVRQSVESYAWSLTYYIPFHASNDTQTPSYYGTNSWLFCNVINQQEDLEVDLDNLEERLEKELLALRDQVATPPPPPPPPHTHHARIISTQLGTILLTDPIHSSLRNPIPISLTLTPSHPTLLYLDIFSHNVSQYTSHNTLSHVITHSHVTTLSPHTCFPRTRVSALLTTPTHTLSPTHTLPPSLTCFPRTRVRTIWTARRCMRAPRSWTSTWAAWRALSRRSCTTTTTHDNPVPPAVAAVAVTQVG